MTHRDIIVIGGSSGATVPLKAILHALPHDITAAVFVVLHVPARSLGLLATVTAAAAGLPVRAAREGLAIRPGQIYLGMPDHHLILAEGLIRLGSGPRENMARPSIDPLFRSAAVAYGPRVIGVVLSGLLNDGASGLDAIGRCGGVTIVQDPADALADEMPRSALAAADVDLTIPARGSATCWPTSCARPPARRRRCRPRSGSRSTSPPASGSTAASCAGSGNPWR